MTAVGVSFDSSFSLHSLVMSSTCLLFGFQSVSCGLHFVPLHKLRFPVISSPHHVGLMRGITQLSWSVLLQTYNFFGSAWRLCIQVSSGHTTIIANCIDDVSVDEALVPATSLDARTSCCSSSSSVSRRSQLHDVLSRTHGSLRRKSQRHQQLITHQNVLGLMSPTLVCFSFSVPCLSCVSNQHPDE